MFDIKSLAVSDTSDLHLRNGNDELLFDQDKNPITITLYGPGSKPYAKAVSNQQNRMLDKLKRKGKADQTAEQKAEDQAVFLASITVSFNNFVYDAGDLAGEAMFKAAYSDTKIGFVPEQVNKHVGDWANFTGPSAKS